MHYLSFSKTKAYKRMDVIPEVRMAYILSLEVTLGWIDKKFDPLHLKSIKIIEE